MPTEVIDIVDTAVKIGLGALISGTATYRITNLNHDREIEKSRLSRQRELLEEIAGQTEQFSNAVLKYWAYMVEYVRKKNRQAAIPEELNQRIETASKDVFDTISFLSSAEGKLILLGADKAQVILREYGEFVKAFRRVAWPGNANLTEQKLDEYRTQLLKKRMSLYSEIRRAYEKGTQ